MSYLTDAETVIKSAQPGLMIYGRAKQYLDTPWKTVLFVREETGRIRSIPQNPTIELRSSLMRVDNIYLVPILIKMGGELYESWLNYHASGGSGADAMHDLSQQEQIAILFFGDSLTQERSLLFRNSCRLDFKTMLDQLNVSVPWGMREFDKAREKLYWSYPTVKQLWNGIGGKYE